MTASRLLKVIVLTFLSCFVVIGILMYFNLGVNKDPKILGEKESEFHFLYKDNVGPYHEVSKEILAIEKLARDNQIACRKTFGEYLDNPELVDPDRLRSRIGCILEDPKVVGNSTPEGLKILSKPLKKYLLISFDGSPAIGPFKVYPLAENKWNHEGSDNGVIEVYTVLEGGKSMITEYYFPL